MNSDKIHVGNIGEKYVMYLFSKMFLECFKLPATFNYDLITENGIRIEVKTSMIHKEKPGKHSRLEYSRDYWSFNNQESKKTFYKDFDYYIFICLNEKLNVEKLFCVPRIVINNRIIISIPKNFKRLNNNSNIFSLKNFENNFSIFKDI